MGVNPLQLALATIHTEIPRAILKMAFTDPAEPGVSIDARILREVFRRKVLLDLNAEVGKTKNIPLLESWRVPVDDPPYESAYTAVAAQSLVYLIPAEARDHMDIVDVAQLTYGTLYSMSPQAGVLFEGGRANTVPGLATQAVRSHTLSDVSPAPTPIYLGNNMVKVNPPLFNGGLVLECYICYDEEMTGLLPGAAVSLKELMLCATKKWIYNQLVIDIDQNQLVSGQALGKVREIVDDYRSENERYEQLIRDFRGNTLFDPERARKLYYYML